ncbi:septum site-determining protein Ssd [Paenarthrobacter sp. NPDC018779]|uniref:septum site-determining protein Ssd n=1 Tax=Paenarthrobacter sp. NPDC018779 TaxID=3364375 RepID=UPI0037C514B4
MGKRQRAQGQVGNQGTQAWTPENSADILLVTADGYLQDEARRIVAASGGSLHLAEGMEEAMHGWDTADVVLVGSDVRELPPRRRAPAVLLGRAAEGDALWQLAAALGAERVAVLPGAASWLAEHLSLSVAPDPGGTVLGIVGGHGGAGATTTAIWLAQAAAGLGTSTLLIDGDPWGGGLELGITDQDLPGLRWPDFTATRGSIDPNQFRESLPVAGGFTFLSWPGARDAVPPPDTASVAAVLDAARRGYELVVVDIGRSVEALRSFAWDCDKMFLLTTPHLKSAVAASRTLNELAPGDTALLVRGGAAPSVDAQVIADSLGLPLAGTVPALRGVAGATELGRLLDMGQRRPVTRFAEALLDMEGVHP